MAMPQRFNPHTPHFRIRLTASDETIPILGDVTNFLYDLNLIYEIARLATDPKYKEFQFSKFVFYRKGRPLEADDRLHIQSLTLKSPLYVEGIFGLVYGAIGAAWGLVQIGEKFANARLNHRKLKAEVEKLERENLKAANAHIDSLPMFNVRRRILLEPDDHAPEPDKSEVKEAQAAAPDKVVASPDGFRAVLRIREAEKYYDNASNRLAFSPIRVRELEIEVIDSERKSES